MKHCFLIDEPSTVRIPARAFALTHIKIIFCLYSLYCNKGLSCLVLYR